MATKTAIIKCLLCEKSFVSMSGVKMHMDAHRRDDGRLEIPLTRIRIFTSDYEKIRTFADSPLETTRYIINKLMVGWSKF